MKRPKSLAGYAVEIAGLIVFAVGFGLWWLPGGIMIVGAALVFLAQGVGE